jgi:t-SNARE complex subunit (syntaxin)
MHAIHTVILDPVKRDEVEFRPLENTRKRVRQERNRISACECRERCKNYVKMMESQIKVLKQELQECQKELFKYKMRKKKEGELEYEELINDIESYIKLYIKCKSEEKDKVCYSNILYLFI